MDRKLGLYLGCIKTDKQWETLRVANSIGFKSFFTGLYDDQSLEMLKSTADELGMEFEFIHSPWNGINDMWTADTDPEIYFEIKKTIAQAKKYGAGGIIIHVSSGYYPPQICDKGLDRYDRLVAYAKECGVNIAFENLRKIGNVAYMMQRYEKESHVGFCFDTGHAYCYTEKRIPWLEIFGDKLMYTHFHDNYGKTGENVEDKHLLPFEGIIDYQSIIDKLDEYDYKGSIMLESIDENSAFKGEDFIKEAFERATKINSMSKK